MTNSRHLEDISERFDKLRSKLRQHLQLYLVMGTEQCRGQSSQTMLKQALQGGISCFQFREKGDQATQGKQRVELAAELLAICRSHQVPFIVNDDYRLALEIDADGVHIGQEDERPEIVRMAIGPKLLGISAHNPEESRLAVEQGADYIGVGPMYWTTTKSDIREVQGPAVLRAIRQRHPKLPIVGIGGIDRQGAPAVMQAGADGIAVISAITAAADAEAAARSLKEALASFAPRS